MGKITFSLLGLMTLILGTGVWIGLGLVGTGAALAALYRPALPLFKLLAQQTWNTLVSPEMLALPLFIFMAEILFRTKISEALFSGLAPGFGMCPVGLPISPFSAARFSHPSAAHPRPPRQRSGASPQKNLFRAVITATSSLAALQERERWAFSFRHRRS